MAGGVVVRLGAVAGAGEDGAGARIHHDGADRHFAAPRGGAGLLECRRHRRSDACGGGFRVH